MSLILKSLWLWPQCIWRFFFRIDTAAIGKGACETYSPMTDLKDLEVFKHAQMSEIREGRSINFLRLPRKRTGTDEAQNTPSQDGNYTVVAFDAYGCGSSPKPREQNAYSHAEMFADLVAVFRREKGRRNIVVGHSYGSSMALQLAAHEKGAAASTAGNSGTGGNGGVDALVLLAPAFAPDHFPVQTLKMLAPLLRHGFISRALHRETRQGKSDRHRRLIARIGAASGSNPMYICKAFYTQMKWADVADVRASECPVLVLVGESDAMTPLAWAQDLETEMKKNERRHVELGVVAKCSHQLMQEQPDEINKLISEFVTRALAIADSGSRPP